MKTRHVLVIYRRTNSKSTGIKESSSELIYTLKLQMQNKGKGCILVEITTQTWKDLD